MIVINESLRHLIGNTIPNSPNIRVIPDDPTDLINSKINEKLLSTSDRDRVIIENNRKWLFSIIKDYLERSGELPEIEISNASEDMVFMISGMLLKLPSQIVRYNEELPKAQP